MYLIFGLGNPGPEYVGTRHNAGFDLLDALADEAGIEISRNKFKSMVGEGFIQGEKVVLIKPMTYMNLSGEAVVQALNFYKPAGQEVLIVYDDVDLKPGAIRIRVKGSAGGHNGIKSIIGLTGTSEFNRIRIGVGGPRGNMISHVLGKFSDEEAEEYDKGLLLARDAVKTIIRSGVEEAMNRFNSSGRPPKKPKLKKRSLGAVAAREARAKLAGQEDGAVGEETETARGESGPGPATAGGVSKAPLDPGEKDGSQ